MPESTGFTAINGEQNGLSNPTPTHPAFDSIPDVIEAFGMP
jgi:3,4-dihydroxy 2-butanone 4-phosphate synthase